MTIDEILSRASFKLGIEKLNAMQEATSAVKLPTRLLLLAPTGSGKTLAFAIPFLKSLRGKGGNIKGVVVAPTRELVIQTLKTLSALSSPDFKTAAFYGGHDMSTEVNALRGLPDIVVATPGRLLDHLHRGHLSVYDVESLVLDEYDKSLELGFHQEMGAICGRAKNVKTLILTSATQGNDLPDFIGREPEVVLDFSGSDSAAPLLERIRINSPSADKLDTLDSLLRTLQGKKTIVFVNHRDAAERVYGHLKRLGYPAGLYHGGLEQDAREKGLILFGNSTTPVLVATDLASRGLDIDGVEAVVHYHLPPSAESYTHRNGRSGRQGAEGQVYAIVSDNDKVPEYLEFDRIEGVPQSNIPVEGGKFITLYFNCGKKEKLSKGDIAGFLINRGGLDKGSIGKIDVRDHCAYAAVPRALARTAIENSAGFKIKNMRVRITQMKE